MSTLFEKIGEKWKGLEELDMTGEYLLKEFMSDEEKSLKNDKEKTHGLEKFEEGYTDAMMINDLKEDFFNIYMLLEMENILLGRFLYESMEMQEKVRSVSDLFSDIAGDLYSKWEKIFGTDLKDGRG